ncbi:hypothetical protein EIP91_009842 [Steccherinum ochraceum]|uniref:F-box domain-containing protein n=1 Tax=Steccherinum ochraceum TaxID=92696 RepID=A0A4R0RDP7_9APHY|nr:hypothetical protein EIP91_009842 [Steccherinum ochraceum]
MPPARTMVLVKSPLKLSVKTTRSCSSCSCGNSNPFGFFTLPDDVLLLIIGFANVKEILTLRKTSKRLYSMTKLRWVWSNAMKRHIIDKGLPVPAADGIKQPSVSAVDLESRIVHAAKFHENWYSDRPTPRRTIIFRDGHLGSVSQVLFLPGRDGQYLVTVARKMITCWEVPLDGSDAYRLAEWRCEPELTIEKVVVNEDATSTATMACICGHSETMYAELNVLTLDTFHGRLMPRSVLRSTRNIAFPLHCMRGDWVAFGEPLLIWHMSTVNPIRTRNLTDETKVLAAKFIGDYLIVVRQSSVQVLGYNQIDGVGNPLIPGHSAGLAYLAKEAVIVSRQPADGASWPSEPVSVVMRCTDDGFDTIRQYDLPPNPKAQLPLKSASPLPDQYGYPCLFPLHYTRALGVAPSATNLMVGQNGKGMWMETRNVTTSRRTVYPARCLVGFDVTRNGARLACGAMEGESNDLRVSKNELYARRSDMSEILCKSQEQKERNARIIAQSPDLSLEASHTPNPDMPSQ